MEQSALVLDTATVEPERAAMVGAPEAATVNAARARFERDPARVALAGYLSGSPLEAYGEVMASLADEYGLDWRLLPVIATLESSRGVNRCGNNVTGYASCAVDFATIEEGLAVSARTLASYGGDSAWKLCVWNMGPTGCRNGRAVGYTAKGLAEMERLGREGK